MDHPEPERTADEILAGLATGRTLRSDPRLSDPIPVPAHTPSAQLAHRYAELAAATAAQTQATAALVERLSESEWHRSEAERETEHLRGQINYGRHTLITRDDTVPEGTELLIDVTRGVLWARLDSPRGAPQEWSKVSSLDSNPVRYEWPIDDAGPFIAADNGWEANWQARQLAAARVEITAAKSALRNNIGVRGTQPDWGASLAEHVAAASEHDQAYRRELRDRIQELTDANQSLTNANQSLTKQVAARDQLLNERTYAHATAAATTFRAFATEIEDGNITHDDLAHIATTPGDTATRWSDAAVAAAYDAAPVWVNALRNIATETTHGRYDELLGGNL